MKIITEKDFFQCSGGMMPSPFQSKQLIVKQKAQEKYITIQDTSTISSVDFGCKKMMLLLAVIAALIAVAIALIVATGGAALIAIGAAAGAAGAAIGAIAGTLICGQQAAAARKWLGNKSDFKILGLETITGNHVIQCDAFAFLGMQPEVITYAPNIKSWSQAISLGVANFIGNVFEGMMAGAAVGSVAAGGASLWAARGAGGGVMNAVWQFTKSIPSNAFKNFLLSVGRTSVGWSSKALLYAGLIRTTTAVQGGLTQYGQTGDLGLNTVVSTARGFIAMEEGVVHSAANIVTGQANWQDIVGLALYTTPLHEAVNKETTKSSDIKGEEAPKTEESPINDEQTTSKEEEAPKTEVNADATENSLGVDGEAFEKGTSSETPNSLESEGLESVQEKQNIGANRKLSNAEVRKWYNEQLKKIDDSVPFTKENARKICDQRNAIRQQARDMMVDRETAAFLEKTRPIKPFEYYVDKYKKQGFVGEALWERIIKGSKTSNPIINNIFDIK